MQIAIWIIDYVLWHFAPLFSNVKIIPMNLPYGMFACSSI